MVGKFSGSGIVFVQLPLNVLYSFNGQTNLDHFEEDFEVAVEEKISGSIFSFLKMVVDFTWLSIRVNFDFVGNSLQMVFVKVLWLNFPQSSSKGGLVSEEFTSILAKGGSFFASEELDDAVKDEIHLEISSSLNKELFDSFDILLVDILDILVFLLVHGLNQNLDFINLVGEFKGRSFNLIDLGFELVN